MADKTRTYDVERWMGYNDVLNPIICQSVHSVCNGRQFRRIPGLAFTMAMNLQNNDAQIGHLSKEQTRICYMLYLVKEYVRNVDSANDWLEAMLKTFDVPYEHYKSHYKDPLDSGSGKNQMFVENINFAINNGDTRKCPWRGLTKQCHDSIHVELQVADSSELRSETFEL